MRVVHFVHRLPRDYSGAAAQAGALIGQLQQFDDLNCSVVAFGEDTRPDPSVPCHQFVVRMGRGLVGKLRRLVRLYSALRATRSDILHVHGFSLPVVILGILMSKKIVLKTTLLGIDDIESLGRRYPVVFRFAILPMIGAVVSLNRALRATNAAAGDKNYVIPNGVSWGELSETRAPEAREKLLGTYGVSPARLVFLYVGGDSIRKGFQEIPGFWEQVTRVLGADRVHLFVTGRFTRSESMRNLVARCGTQSVTVLPKVVDVRRLLKACDVFVSLSFAEGLPNAVLEAAASNVLVLARKLPGVFDGFLDQSNAILFDHFDSGVLLQLREFVTDGRHLHIDNSRYASTFDLEVIARAYRDLYAALMR